MTIGGNQILVIKMWSDFLLSYHVILLMDAMQQLGLHLLSGEAGATISGMLKLLAKELVLLVNKMVPACLPETDA